METGIIKVRQVFYMTFMNMQISVPEEMIKYLQPTDKNMELQRNALLLYPYIKNLTISHGRAAEILGIHKWELIEIYNQLGLSYLDMDSEELEDEIKAVKDLEALLA
ncbi:MAG: UPF0175 family protein [Candidatus Ornithomonoglobus sp.]